MFLREKRFFNLLVFLISLICCIVVAEIGLRIFFRDILNLSEDEKSLLYRYDDQLGWFPVESGTMIYQGGGRPVEVKNNGRGFRDSEHIIDAQPRIIFLGDSFVWGYDVEKQERFTEKLAAKVPHVSIYNLGISGYGTDQEFLLLQKQYDFYKPDIVFLVFSPGDVDDNGWNWRYGYFKPYFIDTGDSLELQGVPVPKAWRYFLMRHNVLSHSCVFKLLTASYFAYWGPSHLKIKRDPTCAILADMQKYVELHGAKFMVGLVTLKNTPPEVKQCLEKNHIPYIDLYNSYKYSSHGYHWTPEGHAFVSEKIYNYLLREKYLQKLSD
jgi:hypothetical protein